MSDKRLLIVDDDARWNNELHADLHFHCVYKTNLADGMREIDKRKRWDGAMFDKYLLEGDLPFGEGKLVSEAGFILSVAFQEKFPGKRVCICTGSIEVGAVPEHLKKILHPNICRYIYKHSPKAAENVIRFLKGEAPSDDKHKDVLDYLLLQPNFCGLGLDLRAIIDKIVSAVRKPK